ncbi:MAG: FCD domain-containing protein [Lachnospiraceae bacterium]|nr:FCD domain-containing protein [Lachnospiraceae bacterium]
MDGSCAHAGLAAHGRHRICEASVRVRSAYHEQRGDTKQFAQLDNRFHEIMYEACNSKMLEHTLRDFHQYVYRVRRRTLATKSRIKASTQEHRLIMEAIKNKDEKRAEALANQHMINAYNNMLENNFEHAFEKDQTKEDKK